MRALRQLNQRSLRRLLAAKEGNTAVEFAFAAALVLGLIFAAIDLGRVFIVGGLLGDAARQISRENQVREAPFTNDAFTAAAAATITARAAGFLDPNQVSIVTTVYDSFDALAANQVDGGAPPGGEPGQIVKYRLTYDMDYHTPFVGLLMDGALFSHTAEIIVYNEPETEL